VVVQPEVPSTEIIEEILGYQRDAPHLAQLFYGTCAYKTWNKKLIILMVSIGIL